MKRNTIEKEINEQEQPNKKRKENIMVTEDYNFRVKLDEKIEELKQLENEISPSEEFLEKVKEFVLLIMKDLEDVPILTLTEEGNVKIESQYKDGLTMNLEIPNEGRTSRKEADFKIFPMLIPKKLKSPKKQDEELSSNEKNEVED
ncbi:MAG: hypothetical protein ACOCQD_00795 [archaeon]